MPTTKEIFDKIDTNHDGSLSVEELEIGLRALGVPPVSRDKIAELFRAIDINADSRISPEEFEAFCTKRKNDIKKVFTELDLNSDGEVDSIELRTAIESAGLKVSSDQLRMLLRMLDGNRSGKLDLQAFTDALLLLPSINPAAVFDAYLSAPFEVAQSEYSLPRDTKPPASIADAKRPKSMLEELRYQIYTGGLAGVVSRTITAPIDRLKVISQAAVPGEPRKGMFRMTYKIWKEDGFKGFFRGNAVNCVKIAPETGSKFYFFDLFKKNLSADPGNVTVLERFVCGGLAGSTAQVPVLVLHYFNLRNAFFI
jgi:solute carrier family 25 phosphate transporter 23/24/25/41